MIKKIIQVADIHIPNDENIRPYSKMLERFLAELYKEVENDDKNEIRIVLAGDIFHQKIKASNEAKNMFHTMLNFLNAIGATIIIAGNHDLLENNTGRTDSISPTFTINGIYENIHYLDKELNYQSGILMDDNVIWVLYSIFDKYKQPNIEGLKEEYPDHTIIGLYHGDIAGAVTDTGYQLSKGIDPVLFEGCDCVMAGHIHKYQNLKRNGIPIVYSGSLFQQNEGENITNHGFVIWNIQTMENHLHEVFNSHKIYKFKLTSYDDVINDEEKLINY